VPTKRPSPEERQADTVARLLEGYTCATCVFGGRRGGSSVFIYCAKCKRHRPEGYTCRLWDDPLYGGW
jgi:hypothetical protein